LIPVLGSSINNDDVRDLREFNVKSQGVGLHIDDIPMPEQVPVPLIFLVSEEFPNQVSIGF